MRVREVLEKLGCAVFAGSSELDNELNGGYVCDLLSDVMARACEGDIWVTVQAHQNIVAVATLAGLAAIVIAGGVRCEPETIAKADREGVPILGTDLPAFEVVGRLYGMGIRGRSRA